MSKKKSKGQRQLDRFAKMGLDNVSWYDGEGYCRQVKSSEVVAAIDSVEYREIFVILPYTVSGDYVGSRVETSNCEYLVENYGIVTKRCEGYGSSMAIVTLSDLIASQNPNHECHGLWEDLKSLEDYPCLDESRWGELEMEDQTENWDMWGCADTGEAVCKLLGISKDCLKSRKEWCEGMTKGEPSQAFYDILCNNGHSEGCSWWFNVDKIAEGILASDELRPLIGFDRKYLVEELRIQGSWLGLGYDPTTQEYRFTHDGFDYVVSTDSAWCGESGELVADFDEMSEWELIELIQEMKGESQ